MLLFRSVSPEDMGEIKFTAEKASSVAKLKVKGKQGCNADAVAQWSLQITQE